MVDQGRVSRAAELFVKARQTGVPLVELPLDCKPTDADDVNAIIAEVTRQLGEARGGWKITFLYKPRQKPIIAPLFSTRIFLSPALIPPAITHSLLAEPEIAFRVHEALPPRARPYAPQEVAEAIVACPALELNDTRFDQRVRSIREMLDDRRTVLDAHADHQTSGAYVVGKERVDWRNLDFAALGVTMRCGERTLTKRVGGHAFTDPFLPVVVLANELRHSDGLRVGEIIATGSFSGFFPVDPDQPVVAEFEGFGPVSATFCSR